MENQIRILKELINLSILLYMMINNKIENKDNKQNTLTNLISKTDKISKNLNNFENNQNMLINCNIPFNYIVFSLIWDKICLLTEDLKNINYENHNNKIFINNAIKELLNLKHYNTFISIGSGSGYNDPIFFLKYINNKNIKMNINKIICFDISPKMLEYCKNNLTDYCNKYKNMFETFPTIKYIISPILNLTFKSYSCDFIFNVYNLNAINSILKYYYKYKDIYGTISKIQYIHLINDNIYLIDNYINHQYILNFYPSTLGIYIEFSSKFTCMTFNFKILTNYLKKIFDVNTNKNIYMECKEDDLTLTYYISNSKNPNTLITCIDVINYIPIHDLLKSLIKIKQIIIK